jgi:prolyl-tRNA editing enzyme YbaK/EbsC (Cys-tRNA(Pro) deacylase)
MMVEYGQNRWNNLLFEGETAIPNRVLTTTAFFTEKSLSFAISRNEKEGTCVDAASKRSRDNRIGIPLEDELKTIFSEYCLPNNKVRLVLLNVRGDQRIDMSVAAGLFGSAVKLRLASVKTMDFFGVGMGEINPFHIQQIFKENVQVRKQFAGLIVVFDEGLLSKQSTMMTNAGDHTWGIEFRVSDVVKHFPKIIMDQSIVERSK